MPADGGFGAGAEGGARLRVGKELLQHGHELVVLGDRFDRVGLLEVADFEAVGVATGVNDDLFGLGGKTQLVYKGACKSRRKRHGYRSRSF